MDTGSLHPQSAIIGGNMYEQITLPNGVRLLTEAMSGVRSAAVGI